MADDDDDRARCTGKTASGQPCRNRALPGTTRCRRHSFKVPGRPTKLTPDLQERILDAILDGNYVETAAQVAGVNKTTLYRWLRRAEEVEATALEHAEGDLEDVDLYSLVDPAEWVYLDFRHALESARAWAETELVRQVKAFAALGGWQAFMTILERTHPTRWGRRKVLDHRFEGEGRVGKVELVIPSADEVATVARILADAGALAAGDENTEREQED